METIDTLDTQPFKNLVMSIGALPSSFVDSMSYYEALAWLVNYLQTQVIPAVNNNAEALSELQTAFVTLKDYVEHYFDNLDVQEEINNKLDEMAEDGTLADIIWAYWRTNGTGITVKHNIFQDGDNRTDYWITTIPFTRPDGQHNELKQYLVGQEGQTLTAAVDRPASIARNNGFKLCINSATFIQEGADINKTNNKYLIQNGVQIPTDGTRTNLLCIMNDGTLKHYDAEEMTAQQLIDAGVKYSLTAFWTVIEDGVITAEIQSKEDWSNFYQRQVIAQDAEKNIYIFTCNGKPENGGNYSFGMSMEQVANLLLNDYNVTFAFMLDGGGSTSTVIDGIVVNQVSDNINRSERYVPFMLYVEDDKPQSMIDTYNAIGQEVDYLKKEIWDSSVCTRLSNNITSDAESQTVGTVINYKLTGSAYTGSDLPHNDYKYGNAKVTVRDTGSIRVEVTAGHKNHISTAVKYCWSGVWSGWYMNPIVEIDGLTITSTNGTVQYPKSRFADNYCSVAFQLNPTGSINSGSTIASGIKGAAISNSAFYVYDNNNTTAYLFTVDTSGNIVARENIPSGASLRFNFSYLTQ